MEEIIFESGSVPVVVAARVYGKDASWVRAGIISGWLPIGKATRNGKLVTNIEEMNSGQQHVGDPTARCAEARVFYSDRMELVKLVAEETDAVLGTYILQAVTNGISYDCLKARLDIPCCKDVYYDLYRRFFWLLNKERG